MTAVIATACAQRSTGTAPITLDLTRLVRRTLRGRLPTGIDRVGLEYVRHYGPRARALLSARGFHLMLSEHDSQRTFEMLLDQPAVGRHALRMQVARSVMNAALEIGARSSHVGTTLLHTCHSGLEFPRYFESLRRRGIRTVPLIHDLIPLTHPEHCRPESAAIHRRRIHTVLKHSAGVLTNSAATLHSLHSEASASGLPLPSAAVAPLGCGFTIGEAHARTKEERPYFVMLGTIEARKNHWFLLQVWRSIVERIGSRAPKLVVIGQRGWECENALDMLDRCSTLGDVVIEETHCRDDRLRGYLQGCRALLFPSFVEGYGMPLAEALAAGVPVIASDLPVFREIAGDIPEYLDPLDGPGWSAAIGQYARKDSAPRAAQIARMRNFVQPTWQAHFDVVDRFLEALPR
ncbi:glycosyltransferase family 1 protein [Paraburkholderia sp. A1RI-2L]|uniref:glycosyltransferase family 4 protein n=1 Tax=Paraburkholderia sp. A1RI-2L TaxID=3028367 RepID=UPI003B7644DF